MYSANIYIYCEISLSKEWKGKIILSEEKVLLYLSVSKMGLMPIWLSPSKHCVQSHGTEIVS